MDHSTERGTDELTAVAAISVRSGGGVNCMTLRPNLLTCGSRWLDWKRGCQSAAYSLHLRAQISSALIAVSLMRVYLRQNNRKPLYSGVGRTC